MPDRNEDPAQYLEPTAYVDSDVRNVQVFAAALVNGQVTLENGRSTGAMPGQLLRGPGARRP